MTRTVWGLLGWWLALTVAGIALLREGMPVAAIGVFSLVGAGYTLREAVEALETNDRNPRSPTP